MNIEQIKTDLSAGVIVSPATWRKLVEAALMMQEQLKQEANYYMGESDAQACLDKVEAM